MADKIRVAAINYLNSLPLIYPIKEKQFKHEFELILAKPYVCSEMLLSNKVECALIPSIEILKLDNTFEILPYNSISSYGKILSVNLYYRLPLNKIKEVAIDADSRTSEILVKVILKELQISDVQFIRVDFSNAATCNLFDAFVLIGDKALAYNNSNIQVMDLGQAWSQITSLPFVFAFWVCKKGRNYDKIVDTLNTSIKLSKPQISKIALEFSTKSGIDFETCFNYLSYHVKYEFSSVYESGLMTFLSLAAKYNLIRMDTVPIEININNG